MRGRDAAPYWTLRIVLVEGVFQFFYYRYSQFWRTYDFDLRTIRQQLLNKVVSDVHVIVEYAVLVVKFFTLRVV